MDHFEGEDVLFEVPVYRLSPREYASEQDGLVNEALAQDLERRRRGYSMAWSTPDPVRTAGHVLLHRSRPWMYNDMVGVVRLHQDGGTIKGVLYQQEHQRIRRNFRPTLYEPVGTVLECKFLFGNGRPTAAEIYESILDALLDLPGGELPRRRFVDTRAFEKSGPHVDWPQLLGWRT